MTTTIPAGALVAVVLGCALVSTGCVARTPGADQTSTPTASPTPTPSPTTTAAPTLTRQQVIQAAGPLTLRVEVTGCDSYGTGSGFVVGPNLVATVASVVDGAQTVAVRGSASSAASVVGIDRDRQVALLRTTSVVGQGPVLAFAADEPAEGDEVVAITYPDGRPQTAVDGTVNGLNRSLDVDGQRLDGLIQYDAGSSPASSGGPLLDLRGQVAGLTEGRGDDLGQVGYAVSTRSARGLVNAWAAAPRAIDPATCRTKPKSVVDIESQHPDAPGLGYFVRQQFDGLNLGDDTVKSGPYEGQTGYEAAFAVLSGPLKAELGPFDRFRKNRLQAQNRDVVMSKVKKISDVEDSVDIVFNRITSEAAEKCIHAAYRYTARVASGTWTLDSRESLEGDQTDC